MRRALTPTLLLLAAAVAAVPARAGDFTGFYAGINAGYGWGRSRDRPAPGATLPIAPGADRAGSDLPPSAAGAAAALRRTGPHAPGADPR